MKNYIITNKQTGEIVSPALSKEWRWKWARFKRELKIMIITAIVTWLALGNGGI